VLDSGKGGGFKKKKKKGRGAGLKTCVVVFWMKREKEYTSYISLHHQLGIATRHAGLGGKKEEGKENDHVNRGTTRDNWP